MQCIKINFAYALLLLIYIYITDLVKLTMSLFWEKTVFYCENIIFSVQVVKHGESKWYFCLGYCMFSLLCFTFVMHLPLK